MLVAIWAIVRSVAAIRHCYTMQNRSSYIVLCLNSHVSNYRAVAHAQVALSIFIHEIEYVDLDKTCSHRLSHM